LDKTNILKDNLDKSIAVSKKNYRRDFHKKMPIDRQEMEKKEFKRAALEAEQRLPYVWNQEKDDTPDDFKRPSLGFFGGVNFDKEGRII